MIGVCTDSGSQLPAPLAERLGIEVVPLTVTVGDREYLEGIDLDADALYDLLGDDDAEPTITQPSPGQCAAAYEDVAARGCTSIIAVHSSLSDCSAISAARLATRSAPVPVRIVDCGSVSFGVGCCAWAAAQAADAGASLDEIVALIDELAPRISHVFTTGQSAHGVEGIYVGTGIGADVATLTYAASMDTAIAAMAGFALDHPGPLRIGVGASAREALPFADDLERALRDHGRELEIVRYRIGGGLAQRMQPGTVGCFAFPTT
jgi:fatty acid-binding protein DegV